jgi:hypothetical protein
MRETCTSGSVRGGDGDIPTYSASLLPERREMAQEAASLGKLGLGAKEDELAGVVQFHQPGQKQSAEELAQHPDRQKESRACTDPARTVE